MTWRKPRPVNLLAADIGNTNVTSRTSGATGPTAYRTFAWRDHVRLCEIIAEMWQAMILRAALAACSVNPDALAAFEAAVRETLGPDEFVAVVGRDMAAAHRDRPGRAGQDRPGPPLLRRGRVPPAGQACVVADFGTAITIDCVNDDGVFLGGAILPGLKTQAAALHAQTALLPEVELVNPDWVFGRNTREAIIGGLVHGARGAMRWIVESYATELGVWPLVISTGGDAELIGLDEGVVQAVVPELCLLGVAMAFYKSLPPVDEDGVIG